MATVTGLTADRMLAIEAASIVDGDVVGDNLILTKHDGSQINAGNVRGPVGPVGPIGQDLSVLSAVPVLDVGLVNQIRAGRQLTATDFTNMGLSAPLGLWNLSDLSDSSGNGRTLLNKGAVPFGIGINGNNNTAAVFSGSTAQALYIADTGAADPFRIKTGSFGFWGRSSKRGADEYMMSKYSGTGNLRSYGITFNGGNNVASVLWSIDGITAQGLAGISNVKDDRWHFVVAVFDGTNLSLYVDGVQEALTYTAPPFSGAAPFNIGGQGADAGTATGSPAYGRVDEVFITGDVLNEDQIRNLYCVRVPHTLTTVPARASINVRRRRKGASLVSADFPTQPLRLHNFSAGSLGDEGSGNVPLINNGGAVIVAGADGSQGNAFWFNAAPSLLATDAGLPAALTPRSYGCWFKTSYYSQSHAILAWGTQGTADARLYIHTTGQLRMVSGSDDTNSGVFYADGFWHFAVIVEDNAAIDGIKRKMYVDGRQVINSLIMNPITLQGANRFSIGGHNDGSNKFVGQIDTVFVCGYALTADQILSLYAKSSQFLASSPKNSGDHVEAMSATDLLCTFDTLDSQHRIDLVVA